MIKPEFLDVCPSQFKNMAGDMVKCDDIPLKHLLHSGVSKGNRYQWHQKDEYISPLPAPPVKEEKKQSERQVGGDHYKNKGGLQPIDVIDAWELDFYEGSALKYLARHKRKNGAEDLDKAIHYLQLLKERKYPNAG